MSKDRETIILILKKESEFSKEINRLAQNLQIDDLSDYLNGLKDLKSDFLDPLEQQMSTSADNKESVFSDRYWYFERT